MQSYKKEFKILHPLRTYRQVGRPDNQCRSRGNLLLFFLEKIKLIVGTTAWDKFLAVVVKETEREVAVFFLKKKY